MCRLCFIFYWLARFLWQRIWMSKLKSREYLVMYMTYMAWLFFLVILAIPCRLMWKYSPCWFSRWSWAWQRLTRRIWWIRRAASSSAKCTSTVPCKSCCASLVSRFVKKNCIISIKCNAKKTAAVSGTRESLFFKLKRNTEWWLFQTFFRCRWWPNTLELEFCLKWLVSQRAKIRDIIRQGENLKKIQNGN